MKSFAQFSHVMLIDDVANKLVEGGIELTKMYASKSGAKIASVSDEEKYQSVNAEYVRNLMKYCVESAGYKFSGIEMVKNPQIINDGAFLAKFNAILAQVISPVAPAVVSEKFMEVAEVKQIGFGDTARFQVKPNELFIVNDIAEGVQRGALQRLYGNEITVNPTPKQIAYDMPFYHIAAGIWDAGEWSYKVGASFGGYVNALIIKTFTDVITAWTNASSPYVASGFSDANFNTISQRVSSANSSAEVFAMGSLTTIGKVFPSAAGLQYGLGNEIAKVGHLDRYHGVRLVLIDPAQVPGQVNTSATLIVPDGSLYFIGMGSYKPIKVVFEGENVVVETIPTDTPDKTAGMSVTMRLGVSAVVGSRFGAITGIS